MRNRKLVESDILYSTNPSREIISKNQMLTLEVLLDIRDQNKEIKNQLIIMNNGTSIKDYKASSKHKKSINYIDIDIDKIMG